MKIQKIIPKNPKSLLNLGEFSSPSTIPKPPTPSTSATLLLGTKEYMQQAVNKDVMKKKIDMITVPKKPLVLVLPHTGSVLLQARTTLRKSQGILNCCKLQIVLKSQNKLSNTFRFRYYIPKKFTSDVVYKFQCSLCNQSYYRE